MQNEKLKITIQNYVFRDASTFPKTDAFGFGNSSAWGEILRLFPKHQKKLPKGANLECSPLGEPG